MSKKPTVKVVDAPSISGARCYSYRCIACPAAGSNYRTSTKLHAEEAAQLHLEREHRR